MEIREISIFNEFECQGDKCPDTCCRGWIIPLTPEDRVRFLATRGPYKFRFGLAMLGSRLGDFNSSCRTCPFINNQGLCSIQLKFGHEYIPETCRSYPRSYRNYGFFEERYVDLSCIRVAELFISHYKDLELVSYEADAESEPYGTNEDEDYLNDLVFSRGLFIDALHASDGYSGLAAVLESIDVYAHEAQEAFIHGDEKYLRNRPFAASECPSGKSTASGEDAPSRMAGSKFGSGDATSFGEVFPLPASAINYLMNTSLVAEYLKYGSPYIYEVFKIYRDHPAGRYTGLKLGRLYEAYMQKYPDYAGYYAAYYEYYLYKFYLSCYEDYSFTKHVRMGLIHLGLIFFLHVIYDEKCGELPLSEFTHVMSAYNRRAYFNYENLDVMYEVFIADFF